QVLALRGQVGYAVRRIRDDFGRLCAAEALVVDRLLEQRIEGRRDEEVEVGDLRELAQRLRRPETSVPQDASHSRVRLLAPAARKCPRFGNPGQTAPWPPDDAGVASMKSGACDESTDPARNVPRSGVCALAREIRATRTSRAMLHFLHTNIHAAAKNSCAGS